MTRPSAPADGGFDSARKLSEARTASLAVSESFTSGGGLYPAGGGETATDGPCPNAIVHTTSIRHTTRIFIPPNRNYVNRPDSGSYNFRITTPSTSWHW